MGWVFGLQFVLGPLLHRTDLYSRDISFSLLFSDYCCYSERKKPGLVFAGVKKGEREHVWTVQLQVSIHTDILELYHSIVVIYGKALLPSS